MQALDALRKLRTEKAGETKEFKLKLAHLQTHKENSDQLKKVLPLLTACHAQVMPGLTEAALRGCKALSEVCVPFRLAAAQQNKATSWRLGLLSSASLPVLSLKTAQQCSAACFVWAIQLSRSATHSSHLLWKR